MYSSKNKDEIKKTIDWLKSQIEYLSPGGEGYADYVRCAAMARPSRRACENISPEKMVADLRLRLAKAEQQLLLADFESRLYEFKVFYQRELSKEYREMGTCVVKAPSPECAMSMVPGALSVKPNNPEDKLSDNIAQWGEML